MDKKKKVSQAQMRATAEFEKKAYFKTLVRFPAEAEKDIREAAGNSLNGFIVDVVTQKVKELKGNH